MEFSKPFDMNANLSQSNFFIPSTTAPASNPFEIKEFKPSSEFVPSAANFTPDATTLAPSNNLAQSVVLSPEPAKIVSDDPWARPPGSKPIDFSQSRVNNKVLETGILSSASNVFTPSVLTNC